MVASFWRRRYHLRVGEETGAPRELRHLYAILEGMMGLGRGAAITEENGNRAKGGGDHAILPARAREDL